MSWASSAAAVAKGKRTEGPRGAPGLCKTAGCVLPAGGLPPLPPPSTPALPAPPAEGSWLAGMPPLPQDCR